MKTVAVVGANGKMGRLICEGLESDYSVVKIEKNDDINSFDGLDLVIDFASAESSASSANYCESHKVRLIVGATGQTEKQLSVIKKASKSVPVLIAGNFSVGIVLIKKALAEVLKRVRAEDIVIFEKHHKAKVDQPSGTALEIASFIKNISGKVPQILSERGGKEIGTHSIDIYFKDEVINFKHQAFSRDAFVSGVIKATEFLLSQDKPDLYDYENIYDI